jgi:large subunit ribosomal protein L17
MVVAFAGVMLLLWLLARLWKDGEEAAEASKAIPAIELELPEEAPAGELSGAEPQIEEEEPTGEVKAGAETTATETTASDDLKRIEGIGPKIASVLQEAGLTTFVQLADTEVGQLEQILEEADPRLLRLADPSSWPEQAALAAGGEWDALEALQATLERGRRVG